MKSKSQKKARIGIIGVGTWSVYAHFPAIKEHPNAELTAICQRREDKLRNAADRWDVPYTFTDYREMIEQAPLDGLIISTPHNFHYEPTRYAIEHGLDVMLEKPMVLKSEHARELVELAKEKGKELIVGHPLPYTVLAQKARDLITNGKLGKVKFVNGLFASPAAILYHDEPLPDDLGEYFEEHKGIPYSSATYNSAEVAGGGQGQTQVSHTSNLLFYITGRRAVEVYAFMSTNGYLVDAYDAIVFTLDNGALGNISSWGTVSYKSAGMHEFRVMGENGLLIMDMAKSKMTVRWQNGETEEYSGTSLEGRDKGYTSAQDVWPRFAPAQNLVDVILGKGSPVCTGEHGLYTVEFVEAAYKSVAEGQPVTIGK